MTARLRWLLVFLVVGPLAALVALGIWVARNEEVRGDRDVRAVLARRLDDVAVTVAGAMSELERGLLADTDTVPTEPDAVRAYGRAHPRLRRLLLLDDKGRLRFPPPAGPISDDERRFVEETRELWEHGVLSNPARDEATGRSAPYGWHAAAGRDGLGLVFWRSGQAGGRVAVLIPSTALLELLIAQLPATRDSRAGGERIALYDPAGALAYQWGSFAPRAGARAEATLALAAPLGHWRLAHMGPLPARGRATVGIVAGLFALGAAIAGAGIWLYRESTRELRLAGQRVSFVNQVSHELKTPLTNIRMYAELLERHVPADDREGAARLGIVVAESQRLSRLINNILTFSRQEKGKVALHLAPAVVDDVVRDVIAQFAPGFETRGVKVRFEPGAPARVRIDSDVLSQMLGNLLGNVEKYAPGGEVLIATTSALGLATVVVHDSGPGIAAADGERIFRPFVRLGGAAHEGVPGTGIGLGIARDLARLHGGDLRLVHAEPGGGLPGARFQLTLRTEPAT